MFQTSLHCIDQNGRFETVLNEESFLDFYREIITDGKSSNQIKPEELYGKWSRTDRNDICIKVKVWFFDITLSRLAPKTPVRMKIPCHLLCFHCHPLSISCVSLYRAPVYMYTVTPRVHQYIAPVYPDIPCAPLYTFPVCHCKPLSSPVRPCHSLVASVLPCICPWHSLYGL